MFSFGKHLRNESKIVLVFETFFYFSKKFFLKKNEIKQKQNFLGWHTWATICFEKKNRNKKFF